MTKREKQLQLLRRQIKRQEHNRELGIKLLVRATLELPKLRKQEARLETAIGKRQAVKGSGFKDGGFETVHVGDKKFPAEEVARKMTGQDDDLGIPGFLRRGMAAQKAADNAIAAAVAPEVYDAAHAVANAHNAPPTEAQKKLVAKEKRKVREEHKHAELTGKKRKWPATGKDALRQLR